MKLERPPYILCFPGDQSGCGFHRIMRPLDIMAKTGYAAGSCDPGLPQDQLVKALNPDVIVWQRQGEESQIAKMKTYRELLPEAFFVYEVDDALSSVPEKSWHHPYMPPNVDRGLKAGALVCNVITVSTRDLAKHMRELCGDEIEIRVVPNMLATEDFETAHKVRFAARQNRRRDKFRIGWGGGAGHGGDLEILRNAYRHFGDRIEWVFLGFKPDFFDGPNAVFAGATAPNQYTMALANLDCDLMVAPLEDNHFNRCKSNLRLIEAGACSFPVIASPVTPYLDGNPPVFRHAETPEEWIKAIEDFMALSESQRTDHARRLNNWARTHYCLDAKIAERTEAWLPKGTRAFKPKPVHPSDGNLVIVSEDETLEFGQTIPVIKTLADACRSYRGDILYLRKGVRPAPDLIDRVRDIPFLNQAGTISFFANDGGAMAFPKVSNFTGIDAGTAQAIDKAAAEMQSGGEFQDVVSVGYASGPAIYIRRAALDLCGFPAFSGANPEIELTEWSAMVAARGLPNLGYFGAYIFSMVPLVTPQDVRELTAMRMAMRWPQPKVDLAQLAEVREKLELQFHRGHYRGLPPANRNDYAQWAWLYDTPSAKDIDLMHEWLKGRPEIVIAHRAYDLPNDKPYFEVLGDAVEHSDAQWILCTSGDTEVDEHFAAHLSAAIEKNPDAVVVYADHDRLIDNKSNPLMPARVRADHEFKPDLDHHLLLGRDYVTQIVAIRRELVGEMLTKVDPALDGDCLVYDMVLRTIEQYGRIRVAHIRRVCAHLTAINPQKLRVRAVAKAKLADEHARRIGWNIAVVPHPVLADAAQVQYAPDNQESDAPLVSIIIPTKNKTEMLVPCLQTVLSMTKYPNFEVVIIDNGSDRAEMLDYLGSITDPRVRVVKWPEPYNWSKLNNFAVRDAGIKGEFICFLNDDTRVLSHTWLGEMIAAAQVPGVGTVGARLLYPHQAIQHVGVAVWRGNNGHIHKGMHAGMPGYHGIAFLSHEASSVTGACMVTTRKVFEELGGFPEWLSHNYNDVAFCLEAIRHGYVNVVAIRAELQHFEGVTRPAANSELGTTKLRQEGVELGKRYPEEQPYWNPNLAMFSLNEGMLIVGLNFDALQWPALPWPWRQEDAAFGRTMVLGPPRTFVEETREGDSLYELSLVGYEARIAKPPLENCRPFDIRDIGRARLAIDRLGIDRIVITSIGDAILTQLAFLAALGLPIEYRPADAEAACPRHVLRPNGELCQRGWARGLCQGCIDKNGSPHGPVSIMGWHGEWFRFFANKNVTMNLSNIEAPEFAVAINEVFSGNAFAEMLQGMSAQEAKDA